MITRYRRLAALLAVFLIPAAGAVHAQDAQEPSIVVVDMQRIMRESVAVSELQSEIETQRTAYQETLRDQENMIREAEAALAQRRSELSSEEFTAERNELEAEVSKLQRRVVEDRQALDNAFTQSMRTIQRMVIDIADDVATNRGANIVLAKSSVLLSAPEFEITDEVLERLNVALPEVDLPALSLGTSSTAD